MLVWHHNARTEPDKLTFGVSHPSINRDHSRIESAFHRATFVINKQNILHGNINNNTDKMSAFTIISADVWLAAGRPDVAL